MRNSFISFTRSRSKASFSQSSEAYIHAYGNQAADKPHLCSLLLCKEDELFLAMAELGLCECAVCGTYDEIDSGETTDKGWVCGECPQ